MDREQLIKKLEDMFHSDIISSAYCESGKDELNKAKSDIAEFIHSNTEELRTQVEAMERKVALQTRLSLKNQIENDRLRGLVDSLVEFTEHDSKCLCSQWREGRPTTDGGYETLYGYGKQEQWYERGNLPECSCGLSDALAKIAEFKESK